MKRSQILLNRAMLLAFSFLLFTASFTSVRAAGDVDLTFNPGLVNERTTYPATTITRFAVQPDGKIIAGGYFRAVGKIATGGLARFNADGTLDTTFRAAKVVSETVDSYYTITAIAVQSDGKVLFGGSFLGVGGQPRNSLARLNADGSLDASFNPTLGVAAGLYAGYNDIKITADNKIILAGNLSYNSGANKFIVRLNNDGSIDSTFNSPAAINSQSQVSRVEVLSNGKIFAAAANSNGSTTTTVYRLNQDGSVDTSFASVAVGGNVYALKLQTDGKLYIGGAFNTFNGFTLTTINLIRVNADGSLDTSFNSGNSGPNFSVQKIEILANNQLIIGGDFSTFNGVARKNITKLNVDGSLDNSILFTGFMITNDFALLTNGKVLLGGQASSSTGGAAYTPALLRLNSDGSIDANQIAVGNNGAAYKVYVQRDGKILVAGDNTYINNQRVVSLNRLNADGTIDSSFNASSFGLVSDIDVRDDGKILIAGQNSIVRLNNDGSTDRTIIFSGAFDAKFLPGGGAIVAINFQLRKTLETGGFDSSFSVGANNNIRNILIQPDGKFIVTGDFTQIAGVARGRIARINADGTLDTTFNPAGGASGSIFDAVLQADGKIIIGGNFPGINFNNNYKYLARLNTDGSLDTSFNPIVEGGVQSLRVQPNGKILVGGSMYSVNGLASRVVRLNSDGSLDTTFNPGSGPDDAVLTIDLASNGNVIIGGAFTRVNGIDRLGIARLNSVSNTKTGFDFDGDGRADVSVFRPSTGYWYTSQNPATNYGGVLFGQSGDKLVPADYDGDGKTDVAVNRNGNWYIQRSSLGFTSTAFGDGNDIPVPADYDGDGKADIAVFRPSNGTWYLLQSTAGYTVTAFGLGTDKPVPGDYNGDGKAEVAVFRPSNGYWYLSPNPATNYGGVLFGQAEDRPVPADYDGDGRTDVAVFRPSNGTWYLLQSTAGFTGIAFGLGTDAPTPADYDGDGKADVAVFRQGNWYLNRSSQGFTGIQFGTSTDLPIPNAFVR